VVQRQVFFEYFGSPANFYSINCPTITITYHPGLVQYDSSGRNTKWTLSHSTKNNNNK
jgi:hypothetical protein